MNANNRFSTDDPHQPTRISPPPPAPDFGLPARWPLVPVDVAAFYLNRLPEEVALDCDSLWAWDISSRGAARRQLRLWRNSLLALKHPDAGIVIPGKLEQVVEIFLPHRGLRGRELQMIFYCTAQHIAALHSGGFLTVERERQATTGPNASHIYSRQSVADLLTKCSLAARPPADGQHPGARN